MENIRCINLRFYCYNCEQAFNDLANPEAITEVRCPKCHGEFIEQIGKHEYCPHDDRIVDATKASTRDGRYAQFFANPRVQTELSSFHQTHPAAPVIAPVSPSAPRFPPSSQASHASEGPAPSGTSAAPYTGMQIGQPAQAEGMVVGAEQPQGMRILMEEHPGGFTYAEVGPYGSYRYHYVHRATSTHPSVPSSVPAPAPTVAPTAATASASSSMSGTGTRAGTGTGIGTESRGGAGSRPFEERKGPRSHWVERMMSQHLPQYMNLMFPDVMGMNWEDHGVDDPFSANFMGGSVFGRGFGDLNVHDFFSEDDSFFPTHLGINMQDFGLNFASNFRRGNLIDLAQLLSMADYGNAGKPPASKETVSKLPVFKIEEKHCKKTPEGALDTPNCAICCSNINLGEQAQLLPCGHMFHPECTKPWLLQHNTCPICRYELPTDDPYYEEIRRRNLAEQQQQRTQAQAQAQHHQQPH